MLRISQRFTAAATIAALLLLAPVAVQAAPAEGVATPGWGTALLAALERAVHDTWTALSSTLGTGTDPGTGTPGAGRVSLDGPWPALRR